MSWLFKVFKRLSIIADTEDYLEDEWHKQFQSRLLQIMEGEYGR